MSDILTEKDIKRAFDCLNENREAEESARAKRAVKDWAKFYEATNKMGKDMKLGEAIALSEVLYRLAQGYVLVMPQRMKNLVMEQLTPYNFPQEIYDNLLVSENIPVK